MDLIEKIQKHPRSQVARAYRLGLQNSDGLVPLLKVAIRYFMMRGHIHISNKDKRDYKKVCQELDRLTRK